MTKIEKEQDPLLDDEGDGSQEQEPGSVQKPEAPEKPKAAAQTTAKPAPPAPGKTVKEQAIALFPEDIVAQTKYILEHSPQVSFLIPLAEGEKPGAFEEPEINGFKTIVPKGVMVNIPVQVANLLAEKYRIAMTAGKDKRVDRASDVSDALN